MRLPSGGAFDSLERVHHQMEEHELEGAMLEIGYRRIKTFPRALPNGKKLVQMDFRKQAGEG